LKCFSCGLLEKDNGQDYCLRFNKEIQPQDEREISWDCIYYCKIVFEDGEPLSPRQHLILQDQDFRSKKMRGPL
jgi:hypothetical protein